jgi:hypothetical protein
VNRRAKPPHTTWRFGGRPSFRPRPEPAAGPGSVTALRGSVPGGRDLFHQEVVRPVSRTGLTEGNRSMHNVDSRNEISKVGIDGSGGHDPLTCGIDGPCDWCRDHAPVEPPSPWQELCHEFPILVEGSDQPWNEPAPPEPLPAKDICRFVATVLDKRHRQLFEVVFSVLLAERIAAAIAAGVEVTSGKSANGEAA